MNGLVGPLLYVVLALSSTLCAAENITWQPWSEAVFEQARKEGRFVLLDLEAVWCHWCHVMDEQTYHDDAVTKLIRDRYIAVRVDQDARPDLSRRYEDYGWPATIVFAADGKEIVKRSGYVPPQRFALMLARNGDQQARKMAAQTLAESLNLIDPVWGGVYQYSTDGDWKHPHYEKIMFVQAEHMRLYSLAALALGDRRYPDAAKTILRCRMPGAAAAACRRSIPICTRARTAG